MGFGKSVKKTYMSAKRKAFGKGGVKGRYYRPAAVKGLQNLAKDIDMIKSRLNAEKKQVEVDVTTSGLGQCSANADGGLVMDVTPIINAGTGTGV